ncbi:phage tail tape measure protein [Treponema pectinovorum]|uniref:phage tail tape measure protein n=1 Tax=Treponema pectinovorum TaxID=164 RepID=UPI0011C9C077|nr:phage tail tape measure protein [Treponema pectinovorum]
MNEIKAGVLFFLKDKFSQGIKDAGGTVQKFASSAASAIQGIDKAFSGLGTAAGALGVSLSLGAATKEIINLNNRLTRIGLTASASAEQVNALKQKVFEAASDSSIKIDTTSINDALDVVMTKTGDLKYTEDNIRNIAIAIQATGEQGASIGSVFAEFQKFGYTADQISKLMDDMVKQGDQGAFTFGEFAKAGSAVISAYSPIGTAPDDIKRANAAMQIIMMGTKSAEIAVTALGSAMSELSSPDKQQKLMAIGVRVRDDAEQFRDFNDIMADLLKVSEKVGNTDFLGNIFGQTSMQAIRAYSNFYNDMYPKLMDLGDTTGAMEQKSATMAGTLAANLQQVQTAFVRFADAKLTEPLEKLTDLLNRLAEDPDAFNRIFTGIAVGIGSIAAVKGLASVMNLVSSFVSLKKGGGKTDLSVSMGGAGDMGMPVYVTNWGGKAGASPLPSTGSANTTAGRTPTGQPAGTPLNAGSQGNTLQRMGGAASQALQNTTKTQMAMGGAAAGIGTALVAIPNAVNEVAAINADETLTNKEKSTMKGGAIGDAAGTVVGATVGGAAGVAAGAAAGAAIGSIVPVLGTAVGALVGAGIGALGAWLGGKAGRAIGEGIGSAVAGNDEEQISDTLINQLPENSISADMLPSELTNQYMTGNQPFTGTTAELSGSADVNLNLTLTDTRTTLTAETANNTARNIRVNTGSAVEARSML